MQHRPSDDREDIIAELERRITDLRARLPKHSVPTAMALELDALEDELERLRNNENNTESGKSRPTPRV